MKTFHSLLYSKNIMLLRILLVAIGLHDLISVLGHSTYMMQLSTTSSLGNTLY